MSENDKKQAENTAEKNATFPELFNEVVTDIKPKKRSRILKKHETSSNHGDDNDNDDEEGNEISESPPKKKYKKSKIVEKREYNLRARSVPIDTLSESDVLDKVPTVKHKRNHHNTYKTRSWYHQNQTGTENDRMRTGNYEEKIESMEEESIGSEKIESDIQETCVSSVETMDKCIVDVITANSDEISMENP